MTYGPVKTLPYALVACLRQLIVTYCLRRTLHSSSFKLNVCNFVFLANLSYLTRIIVIIVLSAQFYNNCLKQSCVRH